MERVGIPPRRRPPRRFPALALALTVAAGAAPAQAIVPRSMANQEGSGATAMPFGLDQPMRVLCVYDADELPWTRPTLLQAIDLRADNGVPGTTTFAAKQYIDMWLVLSTAGRTSDTVSTNFDDNHGMDRTVVYSGRLALPAQPPLAQAPRPCNVAIPFTAQPFFFDLSPVRGPGPRRPGLAVEFVVNLQPAGDYRLDSPLVCTSPTTGFGRSGPACLTSRGAPLTIVPNPSVRAGDRLTYAVGNMPSMAPFVVAIGSNAGVGNWVGIPLPIPLAPLGATDCWVNTDWLLVTPGLADQSGSGQVSYQLPSGRNLVGRAIHAQAACRDLAANSFLHVTSLGVSATVCGPLPIARVSYVGNARATVGSVSYGSGFVLSGR